MAYFYSPFRKQYTKNEKLSNECPFCDASVIAEQAVKNKDGVMVENEHYFWQVNYFPKFEGHTMVVPKRHITTIGSESAEEVSARESLIGFAAEALQKLYPGSGVEVFLQYGQGSASSIQHLHWHVVPAQPSDPLRSFEKLGHFYTVDKDKEKVLLFPVEISKAKQDLQNALSQIL